jgi:hypothetical protein
LTLIKSILEEIPNFCHFLDFISKGILEKTRKTCFIFLSSRKKEYDGMPRVKWQLIVRTKEGGGWGLKSTITKESYGGIL